MRLMENITSSALKSRVGLNHGVAWNFTPLRRDKVYTVPSALMLQRSTKPGTTCVVPGANLSSWSYSGMPAASVVTLNSYCAMSNPSGEDSVHTVSMPAACATHSVQEIVLATSQRLN